MPLTSNLSRPLTSAVARGVGDALHGFNPQHVAGLSLWLDASRLPGADGAAVTSWPDISGAGRTITPSGAPTIAATALNGRRAVRLNGTNAKFTTDAFVSAGYGNAISVFMVLLPESHTDNRVPISTVGMNFRVEINGGTLTTALNADGLLGDTAYVNHGKSGVFGLSVGSGAYSFGLDRFWVQNLGNPRYAGAYVTRRTNGVSGTVPFTGNALTIGALGTGFYYPGLVGEVLVYNKDVTPAEYQRISSYLASKWGFCTKPLIVCGGDSLTSGQGASSGNNQDLSAAGTNYPSRVLSALSSTHDVRTDSYAGRNLGQMITESPDFADVMVTRNGQRHIYIVWAITNTLSADQSVSSVLSKLQQFCAARRGAGFSVLVGTCLNRGDAVYANFDVDRQAINASILANYATYADGVVDFAAVPELSDYNNATYFNADKIHLTDAGYQKAADAVVAKLASLGW